jgi:hypothetical protein
MSISEKSIAEVVAEASSKMHQPEYISSQVDRFMGAQPQISQYVISHSDELTVEGVVTVLFHSSLIMESVSRSKGTPGPIDLSQLDLAVKAVPDLESLSKSEPNLANYIASNTDLLQDRAKNTLAQTLLAHVTAGLIH